MSALRQIIKITKSDYDTIVSRGSITKNGTTYTYDPDNVLYIVDNGLTDDYVQLGGGSGRLLSTFATSADIANVKNSLNQEISNRWLDVHATSTLFSDSGNITLTKNSSHKIIVAPASAYILPSSPELYETFEFINCYSGPYSFATDNGLSTDAVKIDGGSNKIYSLPDTSTYGTTYLLHQNEYCTLELIFTGTPRGWYAVKYPIIGKMDSNTIHAWQGLQQPFLVAYGKAGTLTTSADVSIYSTTFSDEQLYCEFISNGCYRIYMPYWWYTDIFYDNTFWHSNNIFVSLTGMARRGGIRQTTQYVQASFEGFGSSYTYNNETMCAINVSLTNASNYTTGAFIFFIYANSMSYA